MKIKYKFVFCSIFSVFSLIGCSIKTSAIPFNEPIVINLQKENISIAIKYELYYELNSYERKRLINQYGYSGDKLTLFLKNRNVEYFSLFTKGENGFKTELRSTLTNRINYQFINFSSSSKVSDAEIISIKKQLELILQHFLIKYYQFGNVKVGRPLSLVYHDKNKVQ